MQNLNRPNLLQRIRAVFRPPGLLQPAQQQSSRMPDLERWTMPHRSVDMQDWTVARNMATNVLHPDRSRLMDLYDSILVDSHLASTMETRVLRVVRSRFRLVKDGEAQPDLLHLLETPWFEDFLRYVAEAAFRGHTLIELGELARPGELKAVNRIDPRNVLPWSGMVVRRQGEQTGYKYREAPLNAYLIEVGRPEDLGLLCDVGPVAVVKKYAVGSWSDYVHKYGIPPRWVKTNSRDSRRFKQLETMMQNMLSSAYGVIEGDEEIQIMQTPGTDAHKVFDELISRMNSEISKRLLGQDGTTDNKDASGTYGSLKVLQGVAEDRHAADKASVGYVINQELLPRLTALGYPFAGVRFEWDGLRDLGPMELVDAVSKLGMVFDIDPEYVEERTGIRILGQRRMPGEMGGDWPGWPGGGGGGNPPGNGRQGGGPFVPKQDDHEGEGDDDDEDGFTALWGGTCGVCGGHTEITAAAPPPTDETVIKRTLLDAFNKEYPQEYANNVAAQLVQGLLQGWGTSMEHIDYDTPDNMAIALMRANIHQFSAAKTLAMAFDLNGLLRESKGFSDFKRLVDESGIVPKYTNGQLRAEYQLSVNTGIQGSAYYRMRSEHESLPYWQYRTQGDDRVRDAHKQLDGMVFKWDDDIWKTIYPPNGWNCRCTVDQRYEVPGGGAPATKQQGMAALGAELQKMINAGFAVNRCEIGEVFKLNRAFREKIAPGLKKVSQKGGVWFDFNMRTAYGQQVDKVRLKARPGQGRPDAPPPEANDAKEALSWLTRQRGPNRDYVITDYAGTKWNLPRSTVQTHVTGKKYIKERRWETLHLVPDVLQNPDEVWLQEAGKDAQQVYVKLYGDKAMVVRTRMADPENDRKTMRVYTWHELDKERESKNRHGIPIKRMPIP